MQFRFKRKQGEPRVTRTIYSKNDDFKSKKVAYDEYKYRYRLYDEPYIGSSGVTIESRTDDDCFTIRVVDEQLYDRGHYRVRKADRHKFAEGLLSVIFELDEKGELIVE